MSSIFLFAIVGVVFRLKHQQWQKAVIQQTIEGKGQIDLSMLSQGIYCIKEQKTGRYWL